MAVDMHRDPDRDASLAALEVVLKSQEWRAIIEEQRAKLVAAAKVASPKGTGHFARSIKATETEWKTRRGKTMRGGLIYSTDPGAHNIEFGRAVTAERKTKTGETVKEYRSMPGKYIFTRFVGKKRPVWKKGG